jgi:hypothetical protein
MAASAKRETEKSLARGLRIFLPAGLALGAVGIALALAPVPVPPAYHQFADQRTVLGLPHFGDLMSNLGFLVAGLVGLAGMAGVRDRWFPEQDGEYALYLFYFASIALSSAGSAYYHWAPADAPLFWDRLPITMAFMALFAIFIADRVDRRQAVRRAFPLLLLLGFGALLHWRLSLDGAGGDQRFYLLVQIIPILVIPVLCWLNAGRVTDGRYVAYMFTLYGLAKLAEHHDREVMDLMGGLISGHGIKHLLAAGAAYMVMSMLRRKSS